MEKSKVRMKSWGKASIAGAFLAALVVPLALSANAASQDTFQVKAENTDNPSISSLAGASFKADGEGPEGPEVPVIPGANSFAFTMNTDPSFCTDPKMHFTGVAAGSKLIAPDGAKTDLTEGYNALPQTGKWTVDGSFTRVGQLGAWNTAAESGCLVSVDRWTEDAKTTGASFGNSVNLISVVQPPSTVFNMSELFAGAAKFNQDISGWDVSKVSNMEGMFKQAVSFNQPIGSWNTGSSTRFTGMFQGATRFNQDLNDWNTSKVTDMSYMFSGTPIFQGDISDWDVSRVSLFTGMFRLSNFHGSIGNWTTTSATSMQGMFEDNYAFDGDLVKWNTSKVTNMAQMFNNAAAFSGKGISSWDTAKVTNMKSMFQNGSALNADLSGWNVSKVTTAANHSNFDMGVTGLNYKAPLWAV